MLTLDHILESDAGIASTDSLTLPFALRQKSRQRVRLDSGRDAAIYTPRGSVLRGGQLLRADNGEVVRVMAARETVSTGLTKDGLVLARAAYHLGNRHVPLQVGPGFLRYQHDHVLDDMVRSLGLVVLCEHAEFEPEGGAYAHGHPHDHHHDHPHEP